MSKSLTTNERNNLDAREFGLPKLRKFPLNDENHVLSAIRFFKFAKPENRRELANNIKSAINKFDMNVNIDDDSLLYKYMNPSYSSESYVSYTNHMQDDSYYNNYDEAEQIEVTKYRNTLLNKKYNVNGDASYNNYIYLITKDNEKLNEIFNLSIEYDMYENTYNHNKTLIAIYNDIIDYFTNTENLDEVFFELLNFVFSFINLDNRNYLIRNLYCLCLRNKRTKELNNRIIYAISQVPSKDLTHNDVFRMIELLSVINSTESIKSHYEREIKNDFEIYINKIDTNEYGYFEELPKFESINNLEFSNATILSEGFSIDENGNIKISFNHKESYMDSYSNAHKILHENYKNKNYEGMKTNLAFMFYLISKIEKDKKYKNREPEYVKARAFAINDFKTYLSYLQKYEPSFNFVEYYKQSELGKHVILIPRETIIGIKQLFKAIVS